MNTYIKLAWRNIWRNKRRTLITISAIVFAVVLAVLMQSFNRGSHEVIVDNMTSFGTGHVQIQDYRYDDQPSLDNSFYFDEELESRILQSDERINLLLPRIETFMLAANGQTTLGAYVIGVDTEKEHEFNELRDHKTAGRFFEDREQAAVISEGFARRLGLGVGDTLVLIGQGRFAMSASGLFHITGIMKHPMPDLNNQTVYLPLSTAQEMLSADSYVTALLIALDNDRHTGDVADNVREILAGSELVVYTWPELIPELLELLEFDLIGAYIIGGILYIVIAFGFFGTILTMTLERIKEFGILISLGMKRGLLAFTLFLEVLWMSIVGVVVGAGVAWLVVYYFYLNPIKVTGDMAEMVEEMGWDAVLPVSFAADQFYLQGIIVFFIAICIAIYPMIRVAGLNVIEAARK